MAFFKFRKSSDDRPSAPTPAQSLEALRRRARHRLIGAAVLVLLGVVGFPLLVDKQPRPIAVDIPIEIPDRTKVKPLATGAVTPAPATSAQAAAPTPSSASAGQAKTAIPPASAPKPAASAATAQTNPTKPGEAARTDSGQKAQALLDGKEPAPAAAAHDAPAVATPAAGSAVAAGASAPAAAEVAQERFVVQVGAFADAAKAREARMKLERAGLKTYTQVVDTKEGKRTRVRVGPYTTKAEAEKAADKIKSLDLSAALLTL